MSESQPQSRAPEGEHPVEPLQPLALSSTQVIVWGSAAWVVALVVLLAVPALHEGERSWWPWTCVAALVVGGLGYAYVRRGRGNAADAH